MGAEQDLDALPFGAIVVDRTGTILEYNAYESQLSGLPPERVVGRNFFRDVAPCTAIKEFEGRFEAFVDSDAKGVDPFHFVFPFKRGRQLVTIVFARLLRDRECAVIGVKRRVEDASAP
jgi:photoactive yellow protein